MSAPLQKKIRPTIPTPPSRPANSYQARIAEAEKQIAASAAHKAPSYQARIAEAEKQIAASAAHQTPAGHQGHDLNASQEARSNLQEAGGHLMDFAEDVSGVPFGAVHEVANAPEGGSVSAIAHGIGKATFAAGGAALGTAAFLPGPGTVVGGAAGGAAYDALRAAAAAPPAPPTSPKTKGRMDPITKFFG